jgi:hypothetical protein
MENLKKILLLNFFIPLLLPIGTPKLFAQSSTSIPIEEWFDYKVGQQNLDINNGKLLLNYDKILNKVDRFYFREYQSGTVIYDNQVYYNLILNYDLLNDDLILKPSGESDKNPIILNKSKVKSYSINQKNYINLSYGNSTLPEFINGFYEENFKESKIIYYIKHVKNKKNLINDSNLYDDFISNRYYFIFYKNTYHEISSRKDVIEILPEYKKIINEYYSNNSNEKSDKSKFLKDLIFYLNTIIK